MEVWTRLMLEPIEFMEMEAALCLHPCVLMTIGV